MGMAMTQSPKKRSIIPYYFVAFFLVVLIANLILIYIALSSWTGLETKNHYVKGLKYNEALEGAAAQEKLGWSTRISLDLERGLEGTVSVTVTDKNGNTLSGATVLLKVIRPTHHGYDQDLILAEYAPGRYQTQVVFPLSGNWDLKQVISHGENNFQQIECMFVEERMDAR